MNRMDSNCQSLSSSCPSQKLRTFSCLLIQFKLKKILFLSLWMITIITLMMVLHFHYHSLQSSELSTNTFAKYFLSSYTSSSSSSDEVQLSFSPFPKPVIPVYYINLDRSIHRRAYTEQMLKRKGFKSYYRVPAFNENDTYSSILVNVSYGERPKTKEIACIASHLYAMYLASKENSSFPYALIIEDDIRFELEVDWAAMIANAPRYFTILQITTSNSEFVESEWKKYVNESQQLFSFQNSTSSLKTKEGGALKGSQITPLRREPSFWFDRSQWHHPIWSTQGYIINTAKIRQEINNYVHIDPVTEAVSIQLTATKIFACRENPCLIPFRVVADIYLYSIFAPTYTSKIPLLNGVTGEEHGDIESYIQSNLSVKTHKEQFHRITQILNEIGTKNRTLMPSFLYYHRL